MTLGGGGRRSDRPLGAGFVVDENTLGGRGGRLRRDVTAVSEGECAQLCSNVQLGRSQLISFKLHFI